MTTHNLNNIDSSTPLDIDLSYESLILSDFNTIYNEFTTTYNNPQTATNHFIAIYDYDDSKIPPSSMSYFRERIYPMTIFCLL